MGFMDYLRKAKGNSNLKSAKEGQDAIKNGTPEEKQKAIDEARKRMAERSKGKKSNPFSE